jgi:hypothetical protein
MSVNKLVYNIAPIPAFGVVNIDISAQPDNFGNTLPDDKYASLINLQRVAPSDDTVTVASTSPIGTGVIQTDNDGTSQVHFPIFGASFANIFINGSPSAVNPIMSGVNDIGNSSLNRSLFEAVRRDVVVTITSNSGSPGNAGTLTIDLLPKPVLPFMPGVEEDPAIVISPSPVTALKYTVAATPIGLPITSLKDDFGNVCPQTCYPLSLNWIPATGLTTDFLDVFTVPLDASSNRVVTSSVGISTSIIVNTDPNKLFPPATVSPLSLRSWSLAELFKLNTSEFNVQIFPSAPAFPPPPGFPPGPGGILFVRLARIPQTYRQYQETVPTPPIP